jgi:hypothetical protein
MVQMLKRLSIVFALLGLLATGTARALVLPSPIYTEVGDAAGFLDPQSVVGTGITSIQGSIGDPDLIDAFKFYFAGGPLAILGQARVLDINSDTFSLVDLPITLLNIHGTPSDPCLPSEPCHDTGWLDLASTGLTAGDFIVAACAPTDPCLPGDPPYTISFFTSTTSDVAAEISAPVPEPPTLLLLCIALAFTRRRKNGLNNDFSG